MPHRILHSLTLGMDSFVKVCFSARQLPLKPAAVSHHHRPHHRHRRPRDGAVESDGVCVRRSPRLRVAAAVPDGAVRGVPSGAAAVVVVVADAAVAAVGIAEGALHDRRRHGRGDGDAVRLRRERWTAEQPALALVAAAAAARVVVVDRAAAVVAAADDRRAVDAGLAADAVPACASCRCAARTRAPSSP